MAKSTFKLGLPGKILCHAELVSHDSDEINVAVY